MLITILYILIALILINVFLLIFSCNSPDDEAIKSYRIKIRFPKQKKLEANKPYHLAADK
ncbi:hypothetical protein GCM10010832_00970 [Psychroflexus planctonicus]|uniref:Lipoprotein n=1 Tax=Psychroflexus planctonicus TaxID=1526575 RepID=A0ABQ1SDB6_9FLAO|nr:hypothetical protein GCM10010832_00970 [Psychroflexus planctonicus]